MFRKIKWRVVRAFRGFFLKRKFNLANDADGTFKHIVNTPGQKFSGFLSANVVIGSPTVKDIEMLFEPEEDEVLILAPDEFMWPQLLKLLGVFKSAGQARKNGWDKPIEEGWNEALFKKQRKAVFVLKVT